MRMRYGCISALLALTSCLFAQEHTTVFRIYQPGSPARLVPSRVFSSRSVPVNRIVGRNGDFLQSATLQNVGKQSFASYRIGWDAIYLDGREEIGLGPVIEVPHRVAPNDTVEVPPQHVRPEGAFAMGFFVAEVHGQDGTVWNASLEEIKKYAAPQIESMCNHPPGEPQTNLGDGVLHSYDYCPR
jgi:hypothetical protein